MIRLPPADPALAGMNVALDEASIGDVFERLLRAGAGGAARVLACRPYYVRYKPEKLCRVQYELEISDSQTGPGIRKLAHVELYSARRAEKLAVRHRLDAGGGSFARATYIRELHAIAQFYPVDLRLPGLVEAAAPQRMARRLRACMGIELRGCEANLVRYKAGKRAVLRYKLDGAPVNAVYGKLRRDDIHTRHKITEALRRAGVSTPPTIATLSDIGMIVQAEGAGTRLSDFRTSPAYEEWMPAVAEALAHLHESEVRHLPHRSPSTEANELVEAARVVGRLHPGLAAEAEALAQGLVPLFFRARGESPVHGSFHDDQVLVGETGVVFVDLDSAGLGDPASDVGHFLSYLSADGQEGAYERFLTSYTAVRPELSGDYLAFEAAALLRWATLPFRELRADWSEAVERRVRRAAERLERALPRVK